MYRILSFDGGGIRGVLTARILARLESLVPGFIEKTDLFAGTSTGAILAVGLAKGLSPEKLVDLYIKQGGIIFGGDPFRLVTDGYGLFGAKYTTVERFDGIYPAIGEVTLRDLLPKHVLVATFDLVGKDSNQQMRRWQPRFYHNYCGDEHSESPRAMEVIMRSTAAPTYFPIFDGSIDGGVVAGDPCMCAIAEAIDSRTGKQKLSEVIVVSLGTGTKPQYLECQNESWGLAQWGFRIVDLLLDASNGLADYQCRQVLGDDRYLRINPFLPTAIPLDSVASIDQLIEVANSVDLSQEVQWIKREWMTD